MDYDSMTPRQKLRRLQVALRTVRMTNLRGRFFKPIWDVFEKLEYDLAEIEGQLAAEE